MSIAAGQPLFTKDNPYVTRVTENRLLNGLGSDKETRHFVVAIEPEMLAYTAGDSLGIFPRNDPMVVSEILGLLGATGDEEVTLPRVPERARLRDALESKLSLASPGRKTVEGMAARTTDPVERERLAALLEPDAKDGLARFLEEREFVDLLVEFPGARPGIQEFVDQLRRLVPRLYSIASSPLVHPTEVHLTVAIVRYTTNGRRRGGACTTYLADRVEKGVSPVEVFVAKSHFGPPEDDGVPMIMVGPGTGIAPFRAFLQEREARRASGDNWLFFGDQHRATDFLYEDEFERLRASGMLARLDLAFSRDQTGKVYVQDRMRENGAELWRWLQRGAHFYVCGDAKRMARDVDAALLEIVATHGAMTPEQATAYVRALKHEKRYQRDVY
jgi:sulfite reductase (NADPH) flavoprotein alpha-component